MNALQIKNVILAWIAGMGTILANALGGWDCALAVLIGCMAADYVTGLMVAAFWHRSNKSKGGSLDSRAGFQGLAKKGSILLMVWVATMLDDVTGSSFIRTAVCLFFLSNECISILENLGLMGVPYPAFLRNMLEAIRSEQDKAGKPEGS